MDANTQLISLMWIKMGDKTAILSHNTIFQLCHTEIDWTIFYSSFHARINKMQVLCGGCEWSWKLGYINCTIRLALDE